MLETEAEKRDDEPGARTVAGETHEELAQLVDRHVGGIDDFVRQRADQIHPRAFLANALADRSVRRQRMRPARLAEAPDQRHVGRFQKNQHRIQPRHRPQLPEDFWKRRKEPAFTDIDDDSHFVDVAAGAQRQLGERGNQRRWQVVDAEVTEVLERANRLRLARPGKAREHDERLAACSDVPFGLPHRRRGLPHGRHALPGRLALPRPHRPMPGCPHRAPPPGSTSSSSSSFIDVTGAGTADRRNVSSRRAANARAESCPRERSS